MTVIHIITEQDITDHCAALVAWAEANGLDPKRIDPHGLTIEQVGDRQVIAYNEIQHGANDLPLVDPDHPNQVWKIHRSRTLRHALPDGIGRPVCTCTLGQQCPACLADQATADTEGEQTPGG